MVRTQRLKNEGHRVKTQISSKGVLSVGTGTLITCRQTPMWLGLEHRGDVIMLVLRAGRGGGGRNLETGFSSCYWSKLFLPE